MPTPQPSDIRAFFNDFEQASDSVDKEALGELFCDVFLNLDPTSVAAVPRDVLIATLPAREKLFGSIGAASADLIDLTETPLDDLHMLVQTTWQTRFAEHAPSQDPLILSSTFLLRQEDGRWRIAAYLNHQDIVAIIRERARNLPETSI